MLRITHADIGRGGEVEIGARYSERARSRARNIATLIRRDVGQGYVASDVGQGYVASEVVHEECAGVDIGPVSLSTEHGERLDAAPPIAITEGVALSVMPLLPQGRLDV